MIRIDVGQVWVNHTQFDRTAPSVATVVLIGDGANELGNEQSLVRLKAGIGGRGRSYMLPANTLREFFRVNDGSIEYELLYLYVQSLDPQTSDRLSCFVCYLRWTGWKLGDIAPVLGCSEAAVSWRARRGEQIVADVMQASEEQVRVANLVGREFARTDAPDETPIMIGQLWRSRNAIGPSKQHRIARVTAVGADVNASLYAAGRVVLQGIQTGRASSMLAYSLKKTYHCIDDACASGCADGAA